MILQLKGVNSEWFTEIITIKEKQRPSVEVNKKIFIRVFQWQNQGGKTKRRSDCASVIIGSCLKISNNELFVNNRSVLETSFFALIFLVRKPCACAGVGYCRVT